MNRSEKAQAILEMKKRFQSASVTLLADYKGLKVSEITQLRQDLRKSNAEMQVVKNTLARLAIKDTELSPLDEFFVGTTAVVVSDTDPVGPAKILIKFARDTEKPKLKAGFLSGKLLSVREIGELAKLPSREEMLSSIMGSMKAPAQNLHTVLTAVPRKLVTVLSAIRDTKSA